MSIPVICDRCRATGIAGASDFAHLGDLLDFTPVPRKTQRADGWTPDKQRAFIAALSATGSKTQAAKAVGMASFGVDQLRKSEGSDSFKAAFARAEAIAARHGSMKLAQGVADAAARANQLAPVPSRLRGLPPAVEPDDDDEDEELKLDLLAGIAAKFLRKVAAERAARLNGEIVAADFYLRQVTILEVLFDLGASSASFDPMEFLNGLRRDRVDVRRICSTAFSDHLDAQRRRWWAEEGQPQRPLHPDPRFFELRQSAAGDFGVEVDDNAYGAMTTPARGYTQEEWAGMDISAQQAARRQQQEEDAAEQRAWEAQAVAEHSERKR